MYGFFSKCKKKQGFLTNQKLEMNTEQIFNTKYIGNFKKYFAGEEKYFFKFILLKISNSTKILKNCSRTLAGRVSVKCVASLVSKIFNLDRITSLSLYFFVVNNFCCVINCLNISRVTICRTECFAIVTLKVLPK